MENKMKNLMLLIGLILFTGCSESKTNKNTINEKIIYVKYTQPIKGYDIQIKYTITLNKDNSKPIYWLDGEIIILSQKDTVLVTDIRSEPDIFSLETNVSFDFDSISDGQIFFVNDYLIPDDSEEETSSIERFNENYNIAPFYFYDVDFDGKDELIKFIGGYGQRNRRLYDFYTFPEDSLLSCGVDGLQFDGGWLFDKKNNRIITDITCGAWCDNDIWKWNEKKDSLVILKTIEQFYCIDNQIETCHTIYKDKKEISLDTIMFQLKHNESNFFDEEFIYKGLDK